MKNVKTILAVIGSLFVIIFLWGAFSSDEEDYNCEDGMCMYENQQYANCNGGCDNGNQAYSNGNQGYSYGNQSNADDFYGGSGQASGNASSNANGSVQHITSEQFRSLVADFNYNKNQYIGNGPCIVDFYAQWCAPCKALSPILDRLAEKYRGKLTIYKIDIDEQPAVSSAYNVESIPTLLFCSSGQIDLYNGAPDEYTLEEMISSML